jgi:hypothetical protein
MSGNVPKKLLIYHWFYPLVVTLGPQISGWFPAIKITLMSRTWHTSIELHTYLIRYLTENIVKPYFQGGFRIWGIDIWHDMIITILIYLMSANELVLHVEKAKTNWGKNRWAMTEFSRKNLSEIKVNVLQFSTNNVSIHYNKNFIVKNSQISQGRNLYRKRK